LGEQELKVVGDDKLDIEEEDIEDDQNIE